MFVKQFEVGGDRNYGYLIADESTKEAAVVDPCYNPQMIIDFAEAKGFEIVLAFNTHGHYDHVNGNDAFTAATSITVLGFGPTPQLGIAVKDGATFPLGTGKLTILHTPGHTEDSICIVGDDAVITGDTLFIGKVGGTGTETAAKAEYDSLHQKLMVLPDDTRVFPGHNYGSAPTSTIGNEKRTNPFIIQPDFKAFVYLKENWAAYKQEHGIA